MNVTDSAHSAASTKCQFQCDFVQLGVAPRPQLHEVALIPDQKGSDIPNDFSPLLTQQDKDKSMTRPVMASRSSLEHELVLFLEKMHGTISRKQRSSQDGCNKRSHGETPESVGKNVGHAHCTAEERFVDGAKDMRPDDLIDEEQAIAHLRHLGFSDRRIERILGDIPKLWEEDQEDEEEEPQQQLSSVVKWLVWLT